MKEILAALDLETIPQVSLGTAALLIFGACAGLVMLRGLLRILMGSVVLSAAGFVAYLTWKNSPALPFEEQLPWLSYAAPVAAGLVTLLLLRAVMRFAVRPFGKRDEEGHPEVRRSLLRRALPLLLSLVPTSVLWIAGATALRSAGSVAEIRRFVDGDKGPTDKLTFLAELKTVIDKALPEGWFDKIDPLADDARVTLAKLIALGGDTAPPPKAIPVLEEPQIRALIENDPRLRALAKARRYADILRDPRLDRVIDDPSLKQMLEGLKL